MLFVAKESGESAKEADNIFGDIAQHEDLANTTFVLAIVWFVLTLALAVRDWMSGRDRQVAGIVGRRCHQAHATRLRWCSRSWLQSPRSSPRSG